MVVLTELGGLIVHHPGQSDLLFPQGAEDDAFLQRLVFLTHRSFPAECVGEQPGQHRLGRKVANDAVGVDRLAAESRKRRPKLQTHPPHQA